MIRRTIGQTCLTIAAHLKRVNVLLPLRRTTNRLFFCNGILCYVYNTMDIMEHDTLVKLCADHFTADDTDTAKHQLYECEEVMKLGSRQGRRRQGPNRANTILRILSLPYTNTPRDYQHLRYRTCLPCLNLTSTTLISATYCRNLEQYGQK